MSTGPEHYREAERLLELAAAQDWHTAEHVPYRDVAIAAARVHAELAKVAALANTKSIAEHPLVPRPDHFGADTDALTWKDVIQ